MRPFVRLPDARWLVAVVLVVNLLAFAAHAILRSRLDQVGQVAEGARLAIPSGIAKGGRKVTETDYSDHRCHVIRYESTRCGSCTLDHSRFETMARQAAERGCSVTVVAPNPDQFFSEPGPGVVELAYPSVTAARTLPSYGTPTTVVARSDWSVAWSQMGSLREGDSGRALATLD